MKMKFSRKIQFLALAGAFVLGVAATAHSAGPLTNTANVRPVSARLYSLDWSLGNTHLAVGYRRQAGDELFILTNNTLATRTSRNLGLQDDAISVRWHPQASPNGQYLAVGEGLEGITGSGQLTLYHFTNSASLNVATSFAHNGPVQAVGWNKNGERLAVATCSSPELRGYRYTAPGRLSCMATQDIGGSPRTIMPNALDFQPTSSNFALGSPYGSSSPDELAIYQLNTVGYSFILDQSFIWADVAALNWHPSGDRLAIGLAHSLVNLETNRIRLYGFNGTTLSPMVSLHEPRSVQALSWDPTGSMLLAGLTNGAGGEIKIFRYLAATTQLVLMAEYESTNAIHAAQWSSNGQQIVTGDAEGYVRLFGVRYADLGVQKSASQNTIVPMSNLVYTIAVTNRGPELAENVEITDTLPVGMTSIVISATAGTCTTNGNVITCLVPILQASGGMTITIQGKVPPSAYYFITNKVSAYSMMADTLLSNNVFTLATAIDHDSDGILDSSDNCVDVYNPTQADGDFDGVGDLCDNCPYDYNPAQEDTDHDGAGDLCDNCPDVFNPGQGDMDFDGLGDDCDPDMDGDGLPNTWEIEWFGSPTAAVPTEDSDGDGVSNLDEYLADTIPVPPTGAQSFLQADVGMNATSRVLSFSTSTNRNYSVDVRPYLLPDGPWSNWINAITGTGSNLVFYDGRSDTTRVYRIRAIVP